MTAPERVFLTTIQALDYATGAGSLAYVPESRALAAEQERDYLTLCLGEANASKDAAHEELAALREQVRVLTPLARAALKERDSWFATFTSQLRVDEMGRNHLSPDTPDTAAARRIVESQEAKMGSQDDD